MKPILFNTKMVKAILDGRKTATRRLLKQPFDVHPDGYITKPKGNERLCPYEPLFQPGNILYVRETWLLGDGCEGEQYYYKTDETENSKELRVAYGYKWRPSIHMPKTAARIFLRVKDVRAERLQDITDEQAKKEGIVRMFDHLSEEAYKRWAHGITDLKQCEQPWNNYLWHGNFGNCGCGNKLSDAWEYQNSGYDNPRDSFSSLWNTTVKLDEWYKYGWDANPYVWVIEFERINKEEAYEKS